jgi:hypothetical protein
VQWEPRFLEVEMSASIHAGYVAPGPKRYTVTESHDHEDMVWGDVVLMVEDPSLKNWLLRLSDFTLHHLKGQADQYVHLAEIPLHE